MANMPYFWGQWDGFTIHEMQPIDPLSKLEAYDYMIACGLPPDPTKIKETPKMKHTREDYLDAARDMYKDDLTVEIGPYVCDAHQGGSIVQALIHIPYEEVERRKYEDFDKFAATELGDKAFICERQAFDPSMMTGIAEVPYPIGEGSKRSRRFGIAQKIADALNAQWCAEKESGA